MKNWKSLTVGNNVSIIETVRVINEGGAQVAVVATPEGKLAGVITDGDVRRAILKGIDLNKPITTIMRGECQFVTMDTPPEKVFETLRRDGLRALPLVHEDRHLAGLVHLDDFLSVPLKRNNPIVIMAGGLGTRLRPLTDDCPKPMLRVGDRPMLELVIENFQRQGFDTFFISVNYKAEMIEEYFGDGSKFGASISYLREDRPLGTAGSLSLLPESVTENFILTNGDVLTTLNAQRLLEFHSALNTMATVCVREYSTQIPFAVLDIADNFVNKIEEKPVQKSLINAGIYALNPKVLKHLNKGERLDMPDLLNQLMQQDQAVAAFPLHEYWSDIGQPSDFKLAQERFTVPFASKM